MMDPQKSPKVDLVLVFRGGTDSLAKQDIRNNAQEAEAEYGRLLSALHSAGLQATGRRGERAGSILVLISAPRTKLTKLVQRERHSDFLRGLPTSQITSLSSNATDYPLSPADRLRLIHEYVTATPSDDGLGIVPGSKQWPRVESIMSLHDHEFNELWMRRWTTRQVGFGVPMVELDKIRNQFGEAVGLYFAFLSSYTLSLFQIAILGLSFYILKIPYSSVYSTLLVFWSIGFVEFWRIRQRRLSIRWGTSGSFRVEKRRAQFEDIVGGGRYSWWKRDLRMLASVPLILVFAALIAAVLTGIFVFEAFVTHLYTGPGHQFISFSPTILFVALVPRILAIYQYYAARLTNWENHSHQSTYDSSLTIKTFALSAVVAYLGLGLSAFVYVPFGEYLMSFVQLRLSATSSVAGKFVARVTGVSHDGSIWEANAVNARNKINPSRLQDQMFAYTVTNQVINTVMEIGLPFVLRKVDSVKNGKIAGKKKRVVFEDEQIGEKEEREFLEGIRHEVSLPDYTLFQDYSEMATQFGYVSLWSTIWPLAPVMALLNNWLEIRSDAFKITHHVRRPIPARTDTIGPWLESLGFITWLSALTNSALVYLFRPVDQNKPLSTTFMEHPHTAIPLNSTFFASYGASIAYNDLIVPALLIALASSHGYILARLVVRHVLDRLYWKGSKEEIAAADADKLVKQQYLTSLGLDGDEGPTDLAASEHADGQDSNGFWVRDEGVAEIQKAVKDA